MRPQAPFNHVLILDKWAAKEHSIGQESAGLVPENKVFDTAIDDNLWGIIVYLG